MWKYLIFVYFIVFLYKILYKEKDMENLTPAMKQYYEIKKEYSDAIVFFRMGDFYEMFWEDAKIAHKILGIHLTTRNKNAKNPEILAGIPYHAKDKYLPLLVNAWYKVAIVEQIGDTKGKGIVQRKVVRVVTPATLSLEWESYESYAEKSCILSLIEEKWVYGVSFIDLVSSVWKTFEGSVFEEIEKQVLLIQPREIILERKMYHNECLHKWIQKHFPSVALFYFPAPSNAYELLTKHFQVKDLKGFWIHDLSLGIEASGLLLYYLELHQKQALSYLKSISRYAYGNYLEIDPITFEHLDILYNSALKTSDQGTLFSVINATLTPMGKRYLKENMKHPLCDIRAIEKRLTSVDALFQNPPFLKEIRERLARIGDLDLILTRIALKRIRPEDLMILKNILQEVKEIFILLHANETYQDCLKHDVP